MIEEEPNPSIINNTTTTGDEEEIPSPPGMFDIDDEFTTSTTTEEDEKRNNYYDNIDNEILQNEYEGTIVFEDCDVTRQPKTIHEQLKKTRMSTIIEAEPNPPITANIHPNASPTKTKVREQASNTTDNKIPTKQTTLTNASGSGDTYMFHHR